MRWQNGVEFLHSDEQLFRYGLHAGETFGKNCLKTDAGNLLDAFQTPLFRIRKLTKTFANGHAVIRSRNVLFLFEIANNDLTRGRSLADSFNTTSRHKAFVVHVVQAIFKARRTQISNKNFHDRKESLNEEVVASSP